MYVTNLFFKGCLTVLQGLQTNTHWVHIKQAVHHELRKKWSPSKEQTWGNYFQYVILSKIRSGCFHLFSNNPSNILKPSFAQHTPCHGWSFWARGFFPWHQWHVGKSGTLAAFGRSWNSDWLFWNVHSIHHPLIEFQEIVEMCFRGRCHGSIRADMSRRVSIKLYWWMDALRIPTLVLHVHKIHSNSTHLALRTVSVQLGLL